MPLSNAFIPYGAYWTTPFCRWQGSLADAHPVRLAAQVAAGVLEKKQISPEALDALVLGITVPQRYTFYGAPWLAAIMGAPGITGATISQACATAARVLAYSACEVELGQRECVLGVTCDKTSNGPHIYYPNPKAPGGRGAAEDWVWDNFSFDPYAKKPMIQTAENVAKEAGFSKEEQDDVTLLRNQQYEMALADDRAFQRRFMVPVDVGNRKKSKVIESDEGVFGTSAEGLAKLRPVMEGGTVSYGTQTFPADANAGIIVASKDRAASLAGDANVTIQVLSYGEARVQKAMMPKAVVPAARKALDNASIDITDVKAIKTHNPFAVNDLYFCREMGVEFDAVNNYGSTLVYGHPQAPAGTRLVIELIEELVQGGGGYGLMSGCAAGDSAMALVIKVG